MGRCSELGSCRLISRAHRSINRPCRPAAGSGGSEVIRQRSSGGGSTIPPHGLPTSAARFTAFGGDGWSHSGSMIAVDSGGFVIRASSASIVTTPSIAISIARASSEAP